MLMKGTQHGLSVIELLVGVAVGLFVLGGAGKLFVDYLIDNRRVLLETRLNQDLRAATDLVVRDLRRAAYWGNASTGVFGASASAPAPAPNPHAQVTMTSTTVVTNTAVLSVVDANLTTGEMAFSYGRGAVNDTVEAAEQSGFRIGTGANAGALQLRNGGGGWQSVTDTGSLFIDTATVRETKRTVDLFNTCPCLGQLTCTTASFAPAGANFATRPRLVVREYALTLAGFAPTDPTRVRREIRETVRVRNDETLGACPP